MTLHSINSRKKADHGVLHRPGLQAERCGACTGIQERQCAAGGARGDGLHLGRQPEVPAPGILSVFMQLFKGCIQVAHLSSTASRSYSNETCCALRSHSRLLGVLGSAAERGAPVKVAALCCTAV